MKLYKWIFATLCVTSTAFPIQATATNATMDNNTNTQESPRVIIALVNERPIYQDQLNSKIQERLDKYKRFNSGKEPTDAFKEQVQKNVLERHIRAEVIYQASQKHKVDDIEAKVNKVIADLKENDPTSEAKIDKIAIQNQIVVDEYFKAHDLANPQLPEKELKAFYEKNKSQFASKQNRIQVSHIVMKEKEKIDNVQKLLLEGQPFEDIAKQYSEDANAINGGELGIITQGYMPKEFDDVAFSINVGELSDIIKTEFGYHILKVFQKEPAGTVPSYESMKDFLAKGFAPKVKSKKMTAHIEQLKNKANIKILLGSTSQEK